MENFYKKKFLMCVAALILAAGVGKRMLSSKPKVLHEIAGKPMISLLLDTISKTSVTETFVVVGHGADSVSKEVANRAVCVFQKNLLGTADAVSSVRDFFLKTNRTFSHVLVLCGDVPLLSSETIEALVKRTTEGSCEGLVLVTDREAPFGYGRIIEDSRGCVREIVEEKNANEEQKKIKRINSGVYCFEVKSLFSALDLIACNKRISEYLLTDVASIFYKNGWKLKSFLQKNTCELRGVNSQEDLADLDSFFQKKYKKDLMRQGVSFVAPHLTYVGADATFGKNVVVEPFVVIDAGVHVPEGTRLRSFSHLS